MEDVYNQIERYNEAKQKFFTDGLIKVKIAGITKEIKIIPGNLEIAKKWIDFKEQDLKDTYGISHDAKVRNTKTLYSQLKTYLFNVLYWFNYKQLTDITEEDIKQVVQGLEQKTLTSVQGIYLSDATLKNTYSRMFKSETGFFASIGKDQIARKIIKRKIVESNKVRFFKLETLKKICDDAVLLTHRLAYWLLFDTGIEVSALVQLTKNNFELKYDVKNNRKYFQIHIPKEISKSTRQNRSNHIHFTETNELLLGYLENLKPDEKLFKFDPPAIYRALKIQDNIHHYQILGEVINAKIQTKDFRSSCATYFLGELGWNMEKVNARIGHTISSSELNKYVTYLGINFDTQREKDIELDMNNYKDKYNRLSEENSELKNRLDSMEEHLKLLNKNIGFFKKIMDWPEEIFITNEGSPELIDKLNNDKDFKKKYEKEIKKKYPYKIEYTIKKRKINNKQK